MGYFKNNDQNELSQILTIFLLQALLIILKLSGYIKWSWWLVLLPIIASVTLSIFVIISLIMIVAYTVYKQNKNK
jgi:fatty acid desaturase